MDEDNNERLAEIYVEEYNQTIIIFPYIWKHYPFEDWYDVSGPKLKKET